ncbi:MAG: alpha/beta hydrolase [Gammaproteobacteria bacterium]|nr:alpha/beta hydrolase [Gammaproteobacteria bacterium]
MSSSNDMERPEWYERALAAETEYGEVEVDGCPIHYAVWGEVGRPGVVLIHGSNAHLEWWRFVAPFLADQFRVAAIDLSGNGDSGWREEVFRRGFRERGDGGLSRCRVGRAALCHRPQLWRIRRARNRPSISVGELGGIIFADFTVEPPERYEEWGKEFERRGGEPARPTRVYEDRGTALGRFRLVPSQPCQHPYVIDYLATKSLREVEGGWTWKFDPALFDHLEMGVDQRDKFVGIPCRTAILLGEHSDDSGARAGDYLRELSGGYLPVFTIPATYHHFMFDEPMATVVAIKGILLERIREEHADTIAQRFAEAGSS